MDTQEFLSLVLPRQGYKIAAIPFKGPHKEGLTQHHFDLIDQLAEYVEQQTAQRKDVYFALASFKEVTTRKAIVHGVETTKPWCSRKNANVSTLQAFWLDIDAGEAKYARSPNTSYPSKRDALEALVAFCRTAGLSRPMVVDSGNGLHVYWLLNTPVTRPVWLPVADRLQRLCVEHGFKVDPARTRDAASILRPIGSMNFKDPANPREVKLLRETAHIYTLEQFCDLLGAESPTLSTPPAGAVEDPTTAALLSRDFPPSDAFKIVSRCPTLRAIVDVKGRVEEPLWRNMLGLVKHTIQGDSLGHEWSSGDPNYSHAETQNKLDRWEVSPPTCTQFRLYSPHCNGCTHNVTSPIHLGYASAPEHTVKVETVENVQVTKPDGETDVEQVVTEINVPIPEGYRWNGAALEASKHIGEGDEATTTWTTFCKTRISPVKRIRQEDGTYGTIWRVWIREHEPPRDIFVPTHVIGEGKNPLLRELGKYEVVTSGPAGVKYMEAFMKEYLEQLKRTADEVATYRTYGWQDDGSFLLGDKLYAPSGEIRDALLEPALQEVRGVGNTRGSLDQWKIAVADLYGGRDMLQHQLMLAIGFSAPLWGLDRDNQYKGCTICFTGGAGRGKTSAAEIACSIYGRPADGMKIALVGKTFTTNALFEIAGRLHSLPMLLDEAGQLQVVELPDLLHAFAQGQPKKRLRADGSLQPMKHSWAMPFIATSNDPLSDRMAAAKINAQAQLLRLLEIPWNPYTMDISKKPMIERALLLYGTPGSVFISWLVRPENRKWAMKASQELAMKLHRDTHLPAECRFWVTSIALAIIGASVAKKLDLFPFNVPLIYAYAKEELKRASRGFRLIETTAEGTLPRLLADMHDGIITTYELKDGREIREAPLYPLRSSPCGRQILNDRLLFLNLAKVRDWCAKNGANMRDIESKGMQEGWLTDPRARMLLGKGTTVVSSYALCWLIDLKILEGTGVKVADIEKVKVKSPSRVA